MKRLVFLLLRIFGINALFRLLNRGRLKVLTYHNVTPDRTFFPNAITPGELDAQLACLTRRYSLVTMNQDGTLQGMDPSRVNILITFDDGFLNNYSYALPVLQRHGIRACFFLIADCVADGATPDFARKYEPPPSDPAAYRTINVEQATEMISAGMTIGSHSLRHDDFSTMPDAAALDDAALSKLRLEQLLQTPIKSFAFPWGRCNHGQPKQLLGHFARIFTTEHGFNAAEDRILRRNEVAADIYQLQAAASGSLDAIANFYRPLARSFLPGSPSRYSRPISTDLYGR